MIYAFIPMFIYLLTRGNIKTLNARPQNTSKFPFLIGMAIFTLTPIITAIYTYNLIVFTSALIPLVLAISLAISDYASFYFEKPARIYLILSTLIVMFFSTILMANFDAYSIKKPFQKWALSTDASSQNSSIIIYKNDSVINIYPIIAGSKHSAYYDYSSNKIIITGGTMFDKLVITPTATSPLEDAFNWLHMLSIQLFPKNSLSSQE